MVGRTRFKPDFYSRLLSTTVCHHINASSPLQTEPRLPVLLPVHVGSTYPFEARASKAVELCAWIVLEMADAPGRAAK